MTRLNILCSARVRLTDDQRDKLKAANHQRRLAQPAPTLPGSSVRAETYQVDKSLHDLTISDLVTSRESISLGIVLKMQKILGVEIISREDLEKAFEGYLDHMLSAEK